MSRSPQITPRRTSLESNSSSTFNTPRRLSFPFGQRLSRDFSSGSFEAQGPQYCIINSLHGWHEKEGIERIVRIYYPSKTVYVIAQDDKKFQKGYAVSCAHDDEGAILWDQLNSFTLLLRKSKLTEELILEALCTTDQLTWTKETKSSANIHLLSRLLNSANVMLQPQHVNFFFSKENVVFARTIFDYIDTLNIERREFYEASLWENMIALTSALTHSPASTKDKLLTALAVTVKETIAKLQPLNPTEFNREIMQIFEIAAVRARPATHSKSQLFSIPRKSLTTDTKPLDNLKRAQ